MARIKLLAVMAAVIAGSITAAPAATAQGSGFVDIVAFKPIELETGQLWAWANIHGFNQPTFPYGPWKFGEGWPDKERVKFGDLDGDTYDDLISVDNNGDIRVFRNVNGLFPGAGVVVGRGWSFPWRTYFADIDGDGRDEIIALQSNGEIQSWHNSGGIDPNTYAVTPVMIGSGWDPDLFGNNIYFADLNGDGRDDLITLTEDGVLLAWYNVNSGYPGSPHAIGFGWNWGDPLEVKFADLNNDGRSDLVSVKGDVRAWRNVNGLFPGNPVTIATGFNDAYTYFAQILP